MVYLLLENGFEMCEAFAPVDILRRGGVQVLTVGVSGKNIKSSHGVEVVGDVEFSEINTSDMEMLIIPGGQPGVDNLWENAAVRELVDVVNKKGIKISAICAAPIILARLGILNEKEATCYPSCGDELRYARLIRDEGVVRCGDIISGRACGDAFDFAFEILASLKDEETVTKVKKAICYE